jgi:hypothetical protein
LIASYLCNSIDFIFEGNSNIEKLFSHYLPSDFAKARADLIKCLTMIPPELIKTQVNMIDALCETVSDGDSDQVPALAEKLMFKQDARISISEAKLYKDSA